MRQFSLCCMSARAVAMAVLGCLIAAHGNVILADEVQPAASAEDGIADVNRRAKAGELFDSLMTSLNNGDFPAAVQAADKLESGASYFEKDDFAYSSTLKSITKDVRRLADSPAAHQEKVVEVLNRFREAHELTKRNDVENGFSAALAAMKDIRAVEGSNSAILEMYRAEVLPYLRSFGLYDIARPLVEDAEDYARATFGVDSWQFATALSQNAQLSLDAGDAQAAEKLIRRALVIRRRLRRTSREYVQDKIVLAHVNVALKRFDEGDALITIANRLRGQNDLNLSYYVRGNLCAARIRLQQDNVPGSTEILDGAKSCLERSWEALHKTSMEQSREAAETLELLAEVWSRKGDDQRAKTYGDQAQDIRRKLKSMAKTISARIAH